MSPFNIKTVIWIYFFLLIFEGALRKWVLPGLATPLLIVRDPVALWGLFLAIKSPTFRNTRWPRFFFGLGVVAFFLALTLGHGNPVVATFGLRILAIHLPFIFVIGIFFEREDVEKLGRIMLMLAIPMVVLIAVQFYLPQSHLVNIGVGGEGTAGFSGALGRSRPPGTFSFTTGTTQFFALAAACFAALLAQKSLRKWMTASGISIVLAVPLSISRTLFFQCAVTVCFLLSGLGGNPRLRKRALGIIVVAIVIGVGATMVPAFDDASEAFQARFENANRVEGGLEGVLIDRFLGGLWGAIMSAGDNPIFGKGLGLGTNAGAAYMTGDRAFLVAEGSWGAIVGELGPILGLLFIAARLVLVFQFAKLAWANNRKGDPFAWILCSVSILWVAQGDLAQPTSLGFTVIAGGMTIASLKKR